MGDVFLKIRNNNSDEREAVHFESEKTEARLFNFSDVVESDNPLCNRYGLVVDYAIKRKMMHQVVLCRNTKYKQVSLRLC